MHWLSADGFQLMTADNFKTFSICKSVGPDAAYECFAFDKSNFNGLYQEFFIPKENISVENNQQLLYHINLLTQKKIYPKNESELEKQCTRKILEEIGGLQNWINNIVPLVNTYMTSTNKIEVNK